MSTHPTPELKTVKVGYLPLTDCAPILMASELGIDLSHGISIQPVYQSSWAQIRDGLINGELDAAQSLYGLVYGTELGIGCRKTPMRILMGLCQNGQAITFSRHLIRAGIKDGFSLKAAIKAGRSFTFANTYPTGTHAMWLYYWLAEHGIDPKKDLSFVSIPPQRIVAALRADEIHGFCAGEPWNALVKESGIGATIATTQSIWPGHPEKALATTKHWVERYPNTAVALTAVLLQTAKWLDSKIDAPRVIKRLAAHDVIALEDSVIASRYLGHYDDGLGNTWQDPHMLKFYDFGQATFPWLSDGIWFMSQFVRWKLLDAHPNYFAVAREVNAINIYEQAARITNTPLPEKPTRSTTLMNDVLWDGQNIHAFLNNFSL